MNCIFANLNKSEILLIKNLNKKYIIFILPSILILFIYPFLFKAFCVIALLSLLYGFQLILKIEKKNLFYIMRYKWLLFIFIYIFGLTTNNKMIINFFDIIIGEVDKAISVLESFPLWFAILVGVWVGITFISFDNLFLYSYIRIKKLPVEDFEKRINQTNQKKVMYSNSEQIYSIIIPLIPIVIAIFFMLHSLHSGIFKLIIISILCVGYIIYLLITLKFL